MGENQENITYEGDYDKDWRSRFHHQWPNMTTLMHQSEITIHPFSHRLSDPLSKENQSKIPEWDSNGQNSWSGIEIKPVEREFSEDISSIPTVVKDSGCKKKCRIVLCVFLILSVIVAGTAGIGLSILLTKDPNDLSTYPHHHDHDHNVEANLTSQQEMYLTNTFCKLVKRLLAKADFPIESGLQECVTRLFLVPGSDDLHIEMHVTPRKGFTIKEKFMRALRESYILEKKGTLRPNIKTMITPVTPDAVRSETTPDTGDLIQLLSSSTASLPTENPGATSTMNSSEPVLGGGAITTVSGKDGKSEITTPKLKHSEEEKHTTVMTLSTERLNKILESSETLQGDGATTRVINEVENGTTAKPVSKLDAEHTTVTTATSLPPIQVAHENYSQPSMIPDVVTTIKRYKTTETVQVSTQSSEIKSTLTFISNGRADKQDSELLNAVPVAIKLFNPEFSNVGSDASKIATAPTELTKKQSSKIVESLMVGGVMKLPIRTDSNFRFLFSSDSNPNTVSRPHAQYDSSNEANKIAKHGSSVIPHNGGWSVLKNSVNTEKPPAPELFRTLRRPVSSTKSFVQGNFKLTNHPKRRIDMSEFADPRVIFS